VRKTGRGQRPHPRREAGHDGRVVEVVGLAWAVADQPGAAVGGNKQRVREARLVDLGLGLETSRSRAAHGRSAATSAAVPLGSCTSWRYSTGARAAASGAGWLTSQTAMCAPATV